MVALRMEDVREAARGRAVSAGETSRTTGHRRATTKILRFAQNDRPLDDRPLPLVRRDTLPEYADYRDTGCELSPSCLRCPFARCQYDVGGGVRRHRLNIRDAEIARMRQRHGAPIDMLADTYGVTRRQIFRILRRAS